MNFAPEKSGHPERIFNRTVETLFSQEQLAVLYYTIFDFFCQQKPKENPCALTIPDATVRKL